MKMSKRRLLLSVAMAVSVSAGALAPDQGAAADKGKAKYWTVYFDCGRGPEMGDMVKAGSRGAAIKAFCAKECSGKWQGGPLERCKRECSGALGNDGRGGDYFGSRSCRYQMK